MRGMDVELDDRNEKIGLKIREATLQKVPYMVVIGDKEVEEQKLSIRTRKGEDLGQLSKEELIKKVEQEAKNKITELE